MRKTGIDDKMVFFVRRFPEPEIGSYFEYRVNKEICNPNEKNKFYLKIGGITFLPKKAVPGKRISTSAERIKDSNYFGGYVYYGETDKKIRCLLYAKRKGLPDMKLVGNPSCLHSVIPRYDKNLKYGVITGMKIVNNAQSGRGWSRFDVKTKQDHKGFFEIHEVQSLFNLFSAQNDWDVVFGKNGIYVGANTSLLMVDTPRAHLYLDYTRNFVYTLFQEGAFICTTRPFTLCFYDEEESEEYDPMRITIEMRDKLSGTPNLDIFLRDDGLNRNRVYFLKTAPNHTFWVLRANKVRRNRETEVMLCIPSGAQFENIMSWDQGLIEVKKRQELRPWTKYVERAVISPPKLKNIDMNVNEPYPQ